MAADRVTTFKIYVGNLADDTSSEDVRKLFEEFGTVVRSEAIGKKAFVHMEDDIEGKLAVEELQDKELNGSKLTIEVARKNEPPRTPTVKLLVKNIHATVDARSLRNLFKKFGYVIEVQVENGEGYVCLEAIGDIRSALNEMNGYKIEDMELAVEPAPVTATPREDATKSNFEEPKFASSPKKKKHDNSRKNKGYGSWDSSSSWSRAQQEYYASTNEDYGGDYDSYEAYDYDYSYDYDSPWAAQSHFSEPEPERILRDPHRNVRKPQFANRHPGGRGFRGQMGSRGMPPRMMPPVPPPHFPGPPMQMRGMPGGGRIMRAGFSSRGQPPRGPRPPFRNESFNEPPFNNRRNQYMQHSNPFMQNEGGNDIFYEDDPVSLISRSMPQSMRMSLSGSNSIPLGSEGAVQRTSWGNPGQRNGKGNFRGGLGGKRGFGRGRPAKFTAVTEEVSPGEKYPVPPPNNPGFRAPNKRPKEEVKRKVKKKKKPLVAAELPDYTVPVPELTKPTVPKGAVLKPFPPPQGQSVIDSDTFGGNASTSFFGGQKSNNNVMDFTTDDIV